VLAFFDAPSHEYVCVFTSNATGALKLVGEAYPFTDRSSYVLPADCHNSVNGIRRFAQAAGAEVRYLDALHHGGFDEAKMRVRNNHQGFSVRQPDPFHRRSLSHDGRPTHQPTHFSQSLVNPMLQATDPTFPPLFHLPGSKVSISSLMPLP
jgi:hypothetical protein